MIITSSIPSWFGADALTVFPFIFVVEKHKNNTALIAHEKVHFKEQKKWFIIPWWIAYVFSDSFRLNAEVRAYKVQVSLGGITKENAAWWLANKYRIGISEKQAIKLLG